jgi:sugar O-acyltransferase (sialic acid O-acetyltransferase NeuD family)
MKKVIIFGTGGFAEVAYFYLKNDSKYDVVGFTENKEFIKKQSVLGLPIIPFEDLEKKYSPSEYEIFIAVVYTKMNRIREKLFNEVKIKGYNLIKYVNSKAIVWGEVDVGENCFILENVVIQPFVKIGNNVIVWSGTHIGHHSTIEDHCFITSHVVISGNVSIGKRCFLGVNSTIRDGIKIADDCLVGAGAIILKDTKEKEIYKTSSSIPLEITSDVIKRI